MNDKTYELIVKAINMQATAEDGPARDTALALQGVLQAMQGDYGYLEFLTKRPLK